MRTQIRRVNLITTANHAAQSADPAIYLHNLYGLYPSLLASWLVRLKIHNYISRES